jgi:uncharacterized Fe-S cluster-containing radical SAM superfamily protein
MSTRSPVINTERLSAGYRARAIDVKARKLLITRFAGSEQESDLTEPTNCRGLGRVRHFRRGSMHDWPSNPLPLDPACRALGLPRVEMLRAQVFQNAVCNWRCWYCFVDFNLLAADLKHSDWATADELVTLYLDQQDPPQIIDLTGGQPDLTPEWVPWMMDALEQRGLADSVFLWSDDNLSNDYFWRFLDEPTRARIAAYKKYSKVCCFKGYNEESFAFNTSASPTLFAEQFSLMARLLSTGIDLYAYVTLTTPRAETVAADMREFVSRLQVIHPNLPLRTIPLEVQLFTPVKGRINPERTRSIELQRTAIDCWQDELARRFSATERSVPIEEVDLRARRTMV